VSEGDQGADGTVQFRQTDTFEYQGNGHPLPRAAFPWDPWD
jgi:hypothetical protein